MALRYGVRLRQGDPGFDVGDEDLGDVLEIVDDMVKVFGDSWDCGWEIVDEVEEIEDVLVDDVENGRRNVGEIEIGEDELAKL